MLSSKLADLEAQGYLYFSFRQLQDQTGMSPQALRSSLNRLKNKGHIAMPLRGFYVILPPRYRLWGCLPAEQFIPGLMAYLGESYYVGLLSAAAYHGAAHHRPQIFQVVVDKPRRKIVCGRVRVEFVVRNNAKEVPTQNRNTPTGYVSVSIPEATAYDLVGYAKKSGGLDNVATLLSELATDLDKNKLLEVASISPMCWTQRLGYLLDLIERYDLSDALAELVNQNNPVKALLLPSAKTSDSAIDKRWKLLVNTLVEPEI